MSLLCSPLLSQTENDTTLLGLPGDNLDLFATLDLFQKSSTIEAFEKSLNEEKTGINNLDLNLDNKVDFIKVVTKQDGEDFTFVLQVDVTEKETQDVAVILVSKDKNKKVTMQIVGDVDLYGKDYVIEPKPAAPAVTANPGYTGTEPVTVTAPATTTVVVVESAPIVQYVYSPVYVPYYPPYTYAYHPPYFAAFTVMAVGVYHHNNYYHHGGYHGGHGNTVVIHNTNNYNNYNNSRNSSNTVNRNNTNGNYNRNNHPVARQADLPHLQVHQQGHQPVSQRDLLHQHPHVHPLLSHPMPRGVLLHLTQSSTSKKSSSSASRSGYSSGSSSRSSSRSGGGGGRRR